MSCPSTCSNISYLRHLLHDIYDTHLRHVINTCVQSTRYSTIFLVRILYFTGFFVCSLRIVTGFFHVAFRTMEFFGLTFVCLVRTPRSLLSTRKQESGRVHEHFTRYTRQVQQQTQDNTRRLHQYTNEWTSLHTRTWRGRQASNSTQLNSRQAFY